MKKQLPSILNAILATLKKVILQAIAVKEHGEKKVRVCFAGLVVTKSAHTPNVSYSSLPDT